MAWILDCLFASAFEPRPRRGEWGPPSRGGGRRLECLTGGGLGLQPQLGALGIGWPPPYLPSPSLLANCFWLKGLTRRGPGINHQLCPEYRAIALMARRDRGRAWGRSLWLSLPLGPRERALRPDLQERLRNPRGLEAQG